MGSMVLPYMDIYGNMDRINIPQSCSIVIKWFYIVDIYIYIVSIYTLTLTVQLFVINNSVTLYMYKLNDINDRQMINDRLHLI